MSQQDLARHHQKTLLRPVLQIRLRSFWGRAIRVPGLYRHYRSIGLDHASAWNLAKMALRSPSLLARIAHRWGQEARRG